MSHHHHYHEPERKTPTERRRAYLKDFLTLLLAIGIVVISFLILNPWSQSVINDARIERQPEGSATQEYYKGVVERVISERTVSEEFSGVELLEQVIEAQIAEGLARGEVVELTISVLEQQSKLERGNTVVIRQETSPEGLVEYSFADVYRMDRVLVFAVIFLVLVVLLSGFKGLGSFFSLVFSVIILVQFLLPQVILGANLFWVTVISALFIVLISIYLSHGFNKNSTVAISSIMITIVISAIISTWAVTFTRLTGLGSDDAFFLASNQMNQFLDIQGVLLAGIVIGTIGVLDDVTITQSTTVSELSEANPKLSSWQLFWRAMNVGREHVVSMVNTLAMAYAGGALPLLLLLTLGNGNPLWVSLNNELIVEEIVRTIAGSIGLLLAVPITTAIAARFLKKKLPSENVKTHNHGYNQELEQLESKEGAIANNPKDARVQL